MTSVAQASGATNRITTYDDYLVHEQELVSLAKSGRECMGKILAELPPEPYQHSLQFRESRMKTLR